MDHQRGFQHGEHQGECKAELALKVIQGRWKVLILRELADGIQRFSDLRCALEGVSQKVLTAQLRDLEAEGVVHRAIHPEVPPPARGSRADGSWEGTAFGLGWFTRMGRAASL